MTKQETALIVGVGGGLSASLARLFAKQGMAIALAARDTAKLDGLMSETGARAYGCDVRRAEDVDKLFAAATGDIGAPDVARLARSAASWPQWTPGFGSRAAGRWLGRGAGRLEGRTSSECVLGDSQCPYQLLKWLGKGLAWRWLGQVPQSRPWTYLGTDGPILLQV